MSEHPILFSGPMVRALLDGTKTQTRRVIKDQSIGERFSHMTDTGLAHLEWLGTPSCGSGVWDVPEYSADVACPYGQPGDRLWVRETWRRDIDKIDGARLVQYRADDAIVEAPRTYFDLPSAGWIPSIHMPRWASRITLEITGVRVERLREISEADAKAEGAEPNDGYSGTEHDRHSGWRNGYRILWEQINGPGSWKANPWVWVVEFKRVLP